jgi:hypothetical protein
MKPLRDKFWKDSKKMIEWCSDEELRVLRNKAYDELERRLKAVTEKFDASEDRRLQAKRNKTKKQARGL